MNNLVNPGDALSPVATITSGPLPSVGAVLIRFDFLTHPLQDPEQAHPGRNYVLMPTQARYLMERIASALATLESAGPQAETGPRH
jgi:hypothetical protein